MIVTATGREDAGIRVKICGITSEEDARAAAGLGADAIGFVFWPGSPRAVSAEHAREIASELPAGVDRVGVFVSPTVAEVERVASAVPLSAVQLHGDEEPAFVATLRWPVIKAVNPSHGRADRVDQRWPERVMLLVDAHDPARRGGTGRTADWAWAARLAARRPVILSGGLHAGNVGAAISRVRAYAVDVSSGVERAPGVKDFSRMHEFFNAVRLAASGEREPW